MLEGCGEPGLPGMVPVQEEFRSEDCSRGSPPVTAAITPRGVAPPPGSILLDYDGTGIADSESGVWWQEGATQGEVWGA